MAPTLHSSNSRSYRSALSPAQNTNRTSSRVPSPSRSPASSDKENAPSNSRPQKPVNKTKQPMAVSTETQTTTTPQRTVLAGQKRSAPGVTQNGAKENDKPESQRKSVKFYNPSQAQSERQEIKRQSRALERQLNDNRDQYLSRDNSGLQETILRANDIYENVKQTSDATLDSRLLLNVSDLAHKKSAQLVLGDSASGIDVDDFVSKCIAYMKRESQPTTSSSQRRRSTQHDADDDEGEEAPLDWSVLGAKICIPHNSRPAVPGFLLGPLSVQKKIRAATQRRVRSQKDTNAETRPESLTKDDIQTGSDSAVSTVCRKIKACLAQHCRQAQETLQNNCDDDMSDEQVHAEMRKHRITETGGPSLFDFVIHPDDFGQTVENLFYVSFLIKEGDVGIAQDKDGLPTLSISNETLQESRQQKQTKHQAVFGIDYQTWKDLVAAYEIVEPLIPSRRTAQAESATQRQVGARGWYA